MRGDNKNGDFLWVIYVTVFCFYNLDDQMTLSIMADEILQYICHLDHWDRDRTICRESIYLSAFIPPTLSHFQWHSSIQNSLTESHVHREPIHYRICYDQQLRILETQTLFATKSGGQRINHSTEPIRQKGTSTRWTISHIGHSIETIRQEGNTTGFLAAGFSVRG